MNVRRAIQVLFVVLTTTLVLRAAEPPPTGGTGSLPASEKASPRKALVDEPPVAPADEALKSRAAKLIRQLDAPTRKQRMQAERELTALGPDLLPHLPPPELLPSVSVREAVRRIRIQLEREKALESIGPSRVTLKGEFPLAEILAAISKQTGNRVGFADLPPEITQERFKVNYEKQTFWPAVDNLLGRASLVYGEKTESGGLSLRPRKNDEPLELGVTYSGPFRVAVTHAGLRPFPNSGPYRIVRLNYRVDAEPRLRPLFVKYRGSDFSAKSSALAPLAPFSPDARPEIPLGEGGRRLDLHSDFRVPATSIPDVVSFHGKLTMTTAAGSEQIAFTRLTESRGVARRRGGVTVKLQEVEFRKVAGDRHQARLRVVVSYDTGGPAFESHRTWIFHNQVYLENKDSRIERDGIFHTSLQRDGGVVVDYGFRDLPAGLDDYRFVYVAPTLLVNVPIEFKLTNIPVSKATIERMQP